MHQLALELVPAVAQRGREADRAGLHLGGGERVIELDDRRLLADQLHHVASGGVGSRQGDDQRRRRIVDHPVAGVGGGVAGRVRRHVVDDLCQDRRDLAGRAPG